MSWSEDENVITRRSLIQRGCIVLGAIAAPTLLAACGGSGTSAGDQATSGATTSGAPETAGTSQYDIQSGEVVFADYGGTSRIARVESFFNPFEAETGVHVVSADADPAKIQLFAENERAEWDLLDTDGWDIVRFADEGLLAELPSWVARCDLVPEPYQAWTTGGYSASGVIGYGVKEGAPVPESWADFWDTTKFPGKRGLPSFAYLEVEAALLATGVPHDEVYPLDFDRAFAKLDELREEILFWDSFGQGMQYLAQGSVSMVLSTNSRVTILKDQGLPVDLVWNDAILLPWTGAAIPKHAPHPDAAFALVDFMSQPEQQAQFARLTFYGPTQSAALELLDEATLEKLPNAPSHADVAFPVNMVELAGQIDEYNRRYTEWIAQD